MQRVAVRGKSADLDIVFFEGIDKGIEFCFVGKQLLGVAVCFSGVSARAHLDGMHAETGDYGQRFLKGLRCIKVFKYAEFHFYLSLSIYLTS